MSRKKIHLPMQKNEALDPFLDPRLLWLTQIRLKWMQMRTPSLINCVWYLWLLHRERTAASKQNVDAFNLQLQNLRYEVLHLRKEVSRCINFRSADENIRLVPVEEFYREADPDISQPDTTQGEGFIKYCCGSESARIWTLALNPNLIKSVRIRSPKYAEKFK